MKLPAALLIGLAWFVLLATAVGAVLTLGALHGGGAVGVGPLQFRLAAGYDRKAQPLLAGRPTRADLDASEALSRQALALFPYDDTAWMRLAYIDSQRPGGLSPKGVAALEMSYELIALDPSLANWRIEFCLQNWSRLTPAVRAAAEVEFLALANSISHRHSLDPHLKAVTDPTGRMVATFWFQRLLAIRAASPAPNTQASVR